MARCLFCGEWAGVNAKWHDSCLREFEENMERAGMLRRVMVSAVRTTVTCMAFLLGLFAAPSRPARMPAVNTQTSPARGLSRRSENDADLRASWRHSDDRSNN
jgi:hypothetical protein